MTKTQAPADKQVRRPDKQERLAIALGAAAAFMAMPDEPKDASRWLSHMDRKVRSWGYERLPEAKFHVAFYEALESSGFLGHLRDCVARREDINASGGPFEITPPGDADELLAEVQRDSAVPADDDEYVFDDDE